MSLFGLFERRSSPESPAVPLTDESLLTWLSGPPVDSGVAVNEHTAMGVSAVYRAAALVSSVAASLPLHPYLSGSKTRVESPLLDNPHPDMTAYELWRLTYLHRCLWGNAFLLKERDALNRLRWLIPVQPSRVVIEQVPRTDANPAGKRFRYTDDWGAERPLTPFEMLHLPGLGYDGVRGYSPVQVARQGIGLALAAERHGAKLFGSGSLLQGLLRTDQKLDQAQVDAMRARWRTFMAGPDNAHEVAVLGSGAEFQSLQMPNDDAQFLESRRFQVSEISRWFGVPPFLMMDTERSTSWGTGLEQQALGFVTFDLHPMWLAPTEHRITRELLPPGRYAKYALEGLLRGDSAARSAFYKVMRETGAFSANEIRELEDRPPVDGGESRLQPLNMAPLGSLPDPDEGTTGDDDEPAE